jgi:hypothetical protein
VQVTTANLNYSNTIEAENASRGLYNRVAVRKVDARSRLSCTIKAPAPNCAFLIDSERMETSRADSNGAPPARPENDALGIGAVDLAPLENFTAKLALLACTPGENYTSGG